MDHRREIETYFMEAAQAMEASTILSAAANRVIEDMIHTLRSGGKIIWCGNGGSASDAQHLAAELVGRFSADRPSLSSVSLATDTSVLTAIANDYGYDEVFARQLSAIGREGDFLVAISTSGESTNVLRALQVARSRAIRTATFTGPKACSAWALSDHYLAAPARTTAHVQEIHIALGQALCGIIEGEIFPEVGGVVDRQ